MEIARLTKRNHYEEITARLKAMMEDGTLTPGDKLPSAKELAERFGVGRSTMREALSALKAMGLIDIRQGGGARVLGPRPAGVVPPELESLRMNRETLLHLLEARRTLEVSNASIAAEKRTDGDLAEMRRIVSEMEHFIGDDAAGERTDLAFHAALAGMTHNPILRGLFDSIVSQLENAIREVRRVELYANRSVAERLLTEHKAVFEAVSSRDADGAARHMKRHLRHVESISMKYL
ncbi:FCD domain-containing protein [Cohnella sp. CFH 77786]|uniref:FadR/GntR family transcriptional regulator n=1 Tax=Cohnella sp. CFH 77786 TaxID=2662265 RepID=UPI001C60F57B|nr:FadR/GntR family transcriptional regulator [Cohnella sp. CFH 77786]MBW5446845.1 FCD domain-containing protein [Cohnella sp. CFH 77786]